MSKYYLVNNGFVEDENGNKFPVHQSLKVKDGDRLEEGKDFEFKNDPVMGMKTIHSQPGVYGSAYVPSISHYEQTAYPLSPKPEAKKKVLQSESIPEFNESINSLSEERKKYIDYLMAKPEAVDREKEDLYRWVKASERLPEGTVACKHSTYGYCEMNVYDDHVTINGYPEIHIFYQFSDSELYAFEWLEKLPSSAPVQEDKSELIAYDLSFDNKSAEIKNLQKQIEENDLIIHGIEEGSAQWEKEYNDCRELLQDICNLQKVELEKPAGLMPGVGLQLINCYERARRFLEKYQHQ